MWRAGSLPHGSPLPDACLALDTHCSVSCIFPAPPPSLRPSWRATLGPPGDPPQSPPRPVVGEDGSWSVLGPMRRLSLASVLFLKEQF